jgi:hypothetical protein
MVPVAANPQLQQQMQQQQQMIVSIERLGGISPDFFMCLVISE